MLFTVNCGDPIAPMNGSVGEYNDTGLGASVTYQCVEGFHPFEVRTAVCNSAAKWIPNPEEYNCTLYIQGMIIIAF